jgi:spermidine/putrescine transport system ATP-binding protein
VATFIGETNIFDGCIKAITGDNITIGVENGDVLGKGSGFENNEFITISVRPEKMNFSTEPVKGFTLGALVRDHIYVGSVVKCIAELPNGNEIKIERLAEQELPKVGEQIYLYWKAEDAVLLHNQDQVFYHAVDNVVLG